MSSSRSSLSLSLRFLAICALTGCRAEATSDDVGGSTASPRPAADSRATVVFLGNSLTAGLGVSPLEAFPALVQVKIDGAGLPFRVINAGISGETTVGGLSRIDWVLEHSPSVLVLALGANDALRGTPPDTIRSNLQRIIDRTRERFPDAVVVIAGMLAPPNMGETYTAAFRSVFTNLAVENGAPLVPFLLEGVAADPSLNQPDGIHPTAKGHEIIADTVWDELRGVLEGLAAQDIRVGAQ
ncbi:MAG: arylesterase [Gemmatimonadota bacterium]